MGEKCIDLCQSIEKFFQNFHFLDMELANYLMLQILSHKDNFH